MSLIARFLLKMRLAEVEDIPEIKIERVDDENADAATYHLVFAHPSDVRTQLPLTVRRRTIVFSDEYQLLRAEAYTLATIFIEVLSCSVDPAHAAAQIRLRFAKVYDVDSVDSVLTFIRHAEIFDAIETHERENMGRVAA